MARSMSIRSLLLAAALALPVWNMAQERSQSDTADPLCHTTDGVTVCYPPPTLHQRDEEKEPTVVDILNGVEDARGLLDTAKRLPEAQWMGAEIAAAQDALDEFDKNTTHRTVVARYLELKHAMDLVEIQLEHIRNGDDII